MKSKLILILLAAICFFLNSVQAQPSKTLLTVNGAKITNAQVDQWVSVSVSDGAKDTPELRQSIVNDLVLREAVAQDAKKTGLLTKGNNAFKIKMAEQNAMMDIWFAQYFASHPVTNDDVRAVYDKQVELSKDPKNSKEYLVSQIVVANEAEGVELIKQINNGASFADLAKVKSLDQSSGQQGGIVGWALPTQLTTPINDLVPNLTKGKVTQTPVKTSNGWHVIKVDDVRQFVMPTFDQARNTIAQGLIQQKRQEAVNALMQSTKIFKGN
ncbi:peptidylprolyl isomerase [Polynucleobacter sp. Tro8-14-1]|jgi:peptidyl-prolyl cis-trans isomerase C|uniref:peptidylprolyl isomerase n=1 Tax=Polynucleobacter sp. Tro8-14-1 TaxID=1758383 RepID=UPI001C0DA5CF|nr:peptidylprolyl isomerase [Polynucleobacter sp. Tro8-14-1]MBU3564163.1 peptidylprolyl isomerase [Polynucleobacter sp. Tro8-14-1]